MPIYLSSVLILSILANDVVSFAVVGPSRPSSLWTSRRTTAATVFFLAKEDNDEESSENPYSDPNYPDLEFINYSDPDYQVDRGLSDEFYDDDNNEMIEAQIEEMREERRVRNDEFQFQTYFTKIWREGQEYAGDWTIYKTSTFLENNQSGGPPRLNKAAKPLQITSRVSKTFDELNHADNGFSAQERIEHHVKSVDATELRTVEKEVLQQRYWPEELSPFDFRGQQGNMVCGSAWTMCTASPLDETRQSTEKHVGPFADYRAEIGIAHEDMRMCVKFEYGILQTESSDVPPPLHLKTMTVCRETTSSDKGDQTLPRETRNSAMLEALFGIPGADGGLFDPPPVGSDDQESQYMLLDVDGHATVLFPYMMDQDPTAHDSNGWVTSLDWTPGDIRYQVDRKVNGGTDILGLRTLELSEVQSADAARFRPKDGGSNMRQ